MTEPGIDSYLICATPRTGSTLLCGLLKSSGVAGNPASYFNRRGLHDYADTWRVARPRDGHIGEAYLAAAVAAGTTPNGVFGVRIMAETLPELIDDLTTGDPGPAQTDLQVLGASFGRLRFVHLRRRDVIAQAVSWAKALQTHYWHPDEPVRPGGEEPHYDEDLIGRLVAAIERFEAEWAGWFDGQGIEPYRVVYEDLADDPLGIAAAVLQYLGLQSAVGRSLEVGHSRQADDLNADWMARFRAR